MRKAAAFFCFLFLLSGAIYPAGGQLPVAAPAAGGTESYFTVHNVRQAHGITLGAETKVGILDGSFDMAAHPDLYAGGMNFLPNDAGLSSPEMTHHGYWMALALHEIAPEAEIFALEAHTQDESARVEAVIKALDWAVEHELDVVTYSLEVFSAAARKRLDPAVERTVQAGVVVVFVDYSHPLNLLPADFGPSDHVGQRDPDLNIFSFDCNAFSSGRGLALSNPDDDGLQRNRPFLAHPSAGPVTAGFVALLRSTAPDASPAQVKRILMETSRPMVYRGRVAVRVPDAFGAITKTFGELPFENQPGE